MSRPPVQRGFTLIELLVTIVIILILLGLGAGIGSWQSRQAEQKMTRAALENLDLMYIEMQALGMSLPSTNGATGTQQLVSGAKGARSLKGMLNGFPENLFTGSTVNDAWGRQILFQGTGARSPYFWSYGPDGVAGGGDNLYSYEVIE